MYMFVCVYMCIHICARSTRKGSCWQLTCGNSFEHKCLAVPPAPPTYEELAEVESAQGAAGAAERRIGCVQILGRVQSQNTDLDCVRFNKAKEVLDAES